jgi:tryptophan synthase alpha chain
VILHANQKALDAGSTVDRCMQIAEQITSRFDIPFLAMTYYNIAFARGLKEFPKALASAGLKGAIIPDLPHEEGDAFFSDMLEASLEPVFLFSPNTSDARMAEIAKRARGLLYCVARKGVTGSQTDFEALDTYLKRCKKATDLPLALGFGVQDRQDVAALVGKVDIAIVGSQAIRVLDSEGIQGIKPFVQSLRAA